MDIAPSQNFVGVFDGISRELLKVYRALPMLYDIDVALIGSTNKTSLNMRVRSKIVAKQAV
ncbi:MAG: hypothetical protein ACLPX9_19890 [Rhodomicrobium sp.]